MLPLILVFALVMVMPVKWAANFADGRNTGVLPCAIASVIAPILAIVAFRLTGGGFNGFMLAYLALLAAYAVIIQIPLGSMLKFALVLLALQMATAMALISFGMNVGKLMLAGA